MLPDADGRKGGTTFRGARPSTPPPPIACLIRAALPHTQNIFSNSNLLKTFSVLKLKYISTSPCSQLLWLRQSWFMRRMVNIQTSLFWVISRASFCCTKKIAFFFKEKLQKVAFMRKHVKRQWFTPAIYLPIMPNVCKHYSC